MHKRPARLAILGMITLLAPLSSSSIANATTIAELSTAQMTDAAIYIVEGTVDRVWTEVDTQGQFLVGVDNQNVVSWWKNAKAKPIWQDSVRPYLINVC